MSRWSRWVIRSVVTAVIADLGSTVSGMNAGPLRQVMVGAVAWAVVSAWLMPFPERCYR